MVNAFSPLRFSAIAWRRFKQISCVNILISIFTAPTNLIAPFLFLAIGTIGVCASSHERLAYRVCLMNLTASLIFCFRDFKLENLLVLTLSIPVMIYLVIVSTVGSRKLQSWGWFVWLCVFTVLISPLLFVFPNSLKELSQFDYVVNMQEENKINKKKSIIKIDRQNENFISLRGIEKLKLLKDPVFKYKIEGVENDSLYFKSQVYSDYVGGVWQANVKKIKVLSAQQDGWIHLLKGSGELDQIVSIKPILPMKSLLQINQPMAYRCPEISVLSNQCFRSNDSFSFNEYQFKTMKRTIKNTEVNGGVDENASYLVMPKNIKKLLGKIITAPPKTMDKQTKLNYIKSSLRKNFSYSLKINGKGVEPLADFIRSKKGWCVHFASAMVLLARNEGMPARVVSGYHATESDRRSDFKTLHLNNAHAWAEIWTKKTGWMLWDATPSSGMTSEENSELNSQIENEMMLMDYLKTISVDIENFKRPILLDLAIIVLVLLFILVSIFSKSKSRGQNENDRASFNFEPVEQELGGIWLEVDRRLSPKLQRKIGEGLSSHAKRVSEDYSSIKLNEILKIHNAQRWGGIELSNKEKSWLKSELQSMAKVIK